VRRSSIRTRTVRPYRGINLWRGVTRQAPYPHRPQHRPHRSAHSTLIIYPIRQESMPPDAIVNWVVEIERDVAVPVDWNKPGRL
jgi:hypothetical protein